MLDNIVDKERVCGDCPHCKIILKKGLRSEPYTPEDGEAWCFVQFNKHGVKYKLEPATKNSLLPFHSINKCGGETKFWNSIDEKVFELNNEIMSKPDKVKKHKVKVEDCDFFMITVDGKRGSFVRQETYDIALEEAKRIAKVRQDGKEVFILGVVASVKSEVKIESKEEKR